MGAQENKAVEKVQDEPLKLESSSLESISETRNQDSAETIISEKESSGEAQSFFDVVKSSQKEVAEETKTPEKESHSIEKQSMLGSVISTVEENNAINDKIASEKESTSVERENLNLSDFVKSTLQGEKESSGEAKSLFDVVKSSQSEVAEETITPEKESNSIAKQSILGSVISTLKENNTNNEKNVSKEEPASVESEKPNLADIVKSSLQEEKTSVQVEEEEKAKSANEIAAEENDS